MGLKRIGGLKLHLKYDFSVQHVRPSQSIKSIDDTAGHLEEIFIIELILISFENLF